MVEDATQSIVMGLGLNLTEVIFPFIIGYGDDEACKGEPVGEIPDGEESPCVDADGAAIEGAVRLVLQLSQSERSRCGTEETKPSVSISSNASQ